MGGQVPKEYYLINNAPTAKKYMQALSIMAGGKKKLKFKVEKANSTLRYFYLTKVNLLSLLMQMSYFLFFSWEFLSEGGDVDFRVYHKSTEGIANDLIPRNRVQSHLFMEEGELVCDLAGECKSIFVNTILRFLHF